MQRFANRRQAGRLLGAELRGIVGRNPFIIALPRGGVPVAFEVAMALNAPLDVWVVRKLGVPGEPELGMGAVAEGGYVQLRPEAVRHAGLSQSELDRLTAEKKSEVDARVALYRGDRERPPLRDRNVVIVDDGIATGGTIAAALASIRHEDPLSVSLAVPVAAADTLLELVGLFETVTCISAPVDLVAIGYWYDDFAQVEDAEVIELLRCAQRRFEDEPEPSEPSEPSAHAFGAPGGEAAASAATAGRSDR